MPANRRNQAGAVRFVPALKAVLLCSMIGGSCVGYVLQKNKIFELGQQIGIRQQKLERLKKDNLELANRLDALQTPRYLADRVREWKLGLVPPQPHQMLWITEPGPAIKAVKVAPQLFVQSKIGAVANP
jgi:hypothetical protein